jgi:predicted Zn finger-like uncharacterized protein
MPIPATCPGCNASYQLADTMLGKKVRCKSCSEVFVVRGKTVAAGRHEDEERIQAVPRPPKRVAAYEEDEAPERLPPRRRPRKKRGNGVVLALVIAGFIAAFMLVLGLGGVAVWAFLRLRQPQPTPVAANSNLPAPVAQPAQAPAPPPMVPLLNPQPQGPLAVELSNGNVSGFGAHMEVTVDYRFTSGNPAGRRLFLFIKATRAIGLRQNYYVAELRSIGGKTQGSIAASGISFGIEHGPFKCGWGRVRRVSRYSCCPMGSSPRFPMW